MIFSCLYRKCGHSVDFPDKEPPRWEIRRYVGTGEYCYKCPLCGAAMAPEFLLIRKENGQMKIFDAQAFGCFSNCPLADECVSCDDSLYAPDCEQPFLKTKCLFVLFAQTDALRVRLDELERRLFQKAKPEPLTRAAEGKEPDI